MPRSSGRHTQIAVGKGGLRTEPGSREYDPVVELKVNGADGFHTTVGRGASLDLTITNEVLRVIHPTGRDEDGFLIPVAGLIDSYVPDGPFWLPRTNRLEDIGYDGQPSTDGIYPNGRVTLVAGLKWTGGKPGSPYVDRETDATFGGGALDCGSVILQGNRRREPNWWPLGTACPDYMSWDPFCFVFPGAPGCSPCSETHVVCDGDAYVGMGGGSVSPVAEGTGDIMIVEGGSNNRRVSMTTGANRYREVEQFQDITTKEESIGSWFTDTGLGSLGGEEEAIKSFIFFAGPSFAEDPASREIQIRMTDVMNYDFDTWDGSGVFDPGHPTYYNVGGTEYEFFIRAFAGGGSDFTADPGTTRVGRAQGRNYRQDIGKTRRPASGVRTTV